MRVPEKEIRPVANEADSKQISGRRSEHHSTFEVRQTDCDTSPYIDLTDLSDEEFRLGVTFYQSGYCHGLEHGRQAEREEAAAFFRAAVRSIHKAAESPPRDVAADEARASRSASWWASRRSHVA